MTTKLTAETITTRQIRDLRDEAMEASDYRMVDWCDVALASHETSDSAGRELQGPGNHGTCTRTDAREICADAINNARAQQEA